MALNPSNSSNLEQLALKGLIIAVHHMVCNSPNNAAVAVGIEVTTEIGD